MTSRPESTIRTENSTSPARGTGPTVHRRGLLRGGAMIAGAAVGGVAASAVAGPGVATAADGDQLTLGQDNAATSTTGLTVGGTGGSSDPALELSNADGPSLRLQPLAADWDGDLELGQIANTVIGPVIGVDSLLGETTTFLATGIDLADLPTPYALPTPRRILDTRTASGRSRIIRTSSGALDARGRITARSWLDVEVTVEDADFVIPSVFVNVTSSGSVTNGYLAVYPPGPFPGVSTLNYQAKVTIANQAFTAAALVSGRYAVRIYSSSTTHVIADLTGLTIKGAAQGTDVAAQKEPATSSLRVRRLRSALSERVRRQLIR